MTPSKPQAKPLVLFAVVIALSIATIGAAHSQKPSQPPPSAIHFEDVTASTKIHFNHNNAAFGKKWLPETMGSGVAFLDYDNDGWQDILLVNGADWPGHSNRRTTLALYHNNHDGTFTDVTKQAGLAVEMMGMGVAIGDYDNDGFDDVFITALGQSRLFHNNGNGTFTDVTQKSGLAGPNEFSTGAAWVDYDRDGHLDLVVANYVQWSPEADLYCTLDGKTKSYCTPESYKGASLRLWHNRGDGTFENATQKAGLADPTSKSLGIAILDANQDGWPDIFVSQRHAAQQALHQQLERHIHGEGRPLWRRLQRRRNRPRRHGRRRRRLRSLRLPQPHHHEFFESDGFLLPQRAQRPLRGRSSTLRHRPRHSSHPRLRLLFLRLRSRRLARHLHRQRSHRRRH